MDGIANSAITLEIVIMKRYVQILRIRSTLAIEIKMKSGCDSSVRSSWPFIRQLPGY